MLQSLHFQHAVSSQQLAVDYISLAGCLLPAEPLNNMRYARCGFFESSF
jgi:hypothetical protein